MRKAGGKFNPVFREPAAEHNRPLARNPASDFSFRSRLIPLPPRQLDSPEPGPRGNPPRLTPVVPIARLSCYSSTAEGTETRNMERRKS